MGQFFFRSFNVLAAAQALGTELSVQPSKAGLSLVVREIIAKTGVESKSIFVEKVFTQGSVAVRSILDSRAASTLIDYVWKDGLFIAAAAASVLSLATPTVLMPGEQIQIRTTGLTAAAQFRVLYEELDNSAPRRSNDPRVTR